MNPQRQLLWLGAFFAAIGVACLWLVLAGCSKTEPRAEFPPLPVTVSAKGTSMAPTLAKDGSVLVMLFARYDDLRAGNVVLYRDDAGGRYLLHRIIAKRGDSWIAQGDNNTKPDAGFVTRANYLGKAVLP